jgi:hypothetical protein
VESNAAIKELARTEGVFLGSVYTGKGFAGLLEHIRTGKVEAGSSIAFLHTGDTANLFEVQGDWRPGKRFLCMKGYRNESHSRIRRCLHTVRR